MLTTMRAVDWSVLAAGAAAIVWVNWYFLRGDRPRPSRSDERRGE